MSRVEVQPPRGRQVAEMCKTDWESLTARERAYLDYIATVAVQEYLLNVSVKEQARLRRCLTRRKYGPSV